MAQVRRIIGNYQDDVIIIIIARVRSLGVVHIDRRRVCAGEPNA